MKVIIKYSFRVKIVEIIDSIPLICLKLRVFVNYELQIVTKFEND